LYWHIFCAIQIGKGHKPKSFYYVERDLGDRPDHTDRWNLGDTYTALNRSQNFILSGADKT